MTLIKAVYKKAVFYLFLSTTFYIHKSFKLHTFEVYYDLINTNEYKIPRENISY